MTIAEMSIRELSLSSSQLENIDMVRIQDKKRKKEKGIFISHKHSRAVERFMKQKLAKEKQEKLKKLMSFAGMASGLFGEKTLQEIKASRDI